jgi:hypothetical protein
MAISPILDVPLMAERLGVAEAGIGGKHAPALRSEP